MGFLELFLLKTHKVNIAYEASYVKNNPPFMGNRKKSSSIIVAHKYE